MAAHTQTTRQKVVDAAGIAAVVLLSPLILAYIGHHKLTRLYALHTSNEPQYKAMRQERKHHRRKSLTISSSASDSEQRKKPFNFLVRADARKLDPQLQSRLFALPAEIRLQIYRDIIRIEPFVHIQWGTRLALCSPVAKEGTSPCRLYSARSHPDQFMEEDIDLARKHLSCMDFKDLLVGMYGILPLLQSCRRAYMDVIDMLYTENTLTMSLDFNFLNFARSIPERHLTTIRSLILHLPQDADYDFGYLVSRGYSWLPSLKVLSRMPTLQRCLFQIFTDFHIEETQHERHLIQDLFRGLKELPTRDVFIIDWVHYADRGCNCRHLSYDYHSWGTTALKDLSNEEPWEGWLSNFRPYEKKEARSRLKLQGNLPSCGRYGCS
ncbi:hypothetical protein DM02DRAFT_611655 [Periconia macrospinosa]|uniref:DUF7730 domain-containing protein n=1 Tax=Periconia macrospinosa TaxID=97972 RepID=A0A2V1E117_9PLEO|nr:hypothetical protein DM02DRAFT_611655 [Periconia macrospinosa]